MTNPDTNFSDSPYINYKIENDVLISTYKNDARIDLEIAKKLVAQRLSFQNGNDYLSLTDARHVKSATKDARDYLAKHDEGLIASAILGEGYVSNMIINMFITFSRHRIPVKAFQDSQTALKWLNEFKKK